MAVCMAFLMSFVMVSVNSGWTEHFFSIWMRSFVIGVCVAIPAAAIATYPAQWISSWLTRE